MLKLLKGATTLLMGEDGEEDGEGGVLTLGRRGPVSEEKQTFSDNLKIFAQNYRVTRENFRET